MRCPFCGGVLSTERDDDLGEGETGGRARMRDHRCDTCAVVLRQTRIDKIGSGEESWRVRSPPERKVDAPASSRAPACERCGGAVILAMPEAHVPAPAYTIAPVAGRLRVRVDTFCPTCGSSSTHAHG